MTTAIAPFKCALSWFICASIFGLLSIAFGQQTLPPLIPVNVSDFTIPFEIDGSVNSIREVELLVSTDRGKRWLSVARQSVETGKFAFHADTDGEYWFTFRTATAGNTAPINGHPQLRVLVNVHAPMTVMSPLQGQSGPLTPPKPERFSIDKPAKPPPTQPSAIDAPKLAATTKGNTEKPYQIFAPKLPGFVPPDPNQKREGDFLDEFLSEMSIFADVEPVAVMAVRSHSAAGNRLGMASNTPPSPVVRAGNITGIALDGATAKPQIIVRWHKGHESWHDAQIDILRRGEEEEQWLPIASNLPNDGEYWWYLTPEDLKPFHVAVRIRSLLGGIHVDVTQSLITIDPQLSSNQRP